MHPSEITADIQVVFSGASPTAMATFGQLDHIYQVSKGVSIRIANINLGCLYTLMPLENRLGYDPGILRRLVHTDEDSFPQKQTACTHRPHISVLDLLWVIHCVSVVLENTDCVCVSPIQTIWNNGKAACDPSMWQHWTGLCVTAPLNVAGKMHGCAREGKACQDSIRELYRAQGIINMQSHVHCLLGAISGMKSPPSHGRTLQWRKHLGWLSTVPGNTLTI